MDENKDMGLKAVIIDDEIDCRDTVREIIHQSCPDISIAGETGTVKQGVELILREKPDLLLLDIQLLDGTAFDILEELKEYHFHIIFITAYDQFALQAIKHSAIDYILKPIDPARLIKAIDKVRQVNLNVGLLTRQIEVLMDNKNNFNRIALPTLEGLRFVNMDQIIHCQAENNYTWFHLTDAEKILVTKTLKEFEEILTDTFFIRIHQSHMINIKFIDRYVKGEGGSVIMTNGTEISVSRRRKELFLGKIRGVF